MSSWKITPSTAHAVPSSTPISECVRTMRDLGCGSILVSDSTHGLVGIFTERDLLKWIDQIQQGGHWNKPIVHLMSKPVITISIDELDQAAEIMIEHGIRHLPILHEDSISGQTLAGIVSMRDLLREMVFQKRAQKLKEQSLHAGMLANDESIRHLIRKIFARRSAREVENLAVSPDLKPLLEQIKALDYLFVDLDGIETKTWTALLKGLNALEQHPEVLLLYEPAKHSEAALGLLSKLSLSKRFSAYMKPVSIFSVLARITSPP